MEKITEKIILEELCKDYVNIARQKYIEVDEKEYPIGEKWRRSYRNDDIGIKDVEKEIEEPYKSVIFTMWGVKRQ